MAKISKIIITRSDEDKPAFAVTTDTDEQVFIPVAVADAAELRPFQVVDAILVSNEREGIPWRAIQVRISENALG